MIEGYDSVKTVTIKKKAFLKENKSKEGKSVIYLPNYNTVRESWRPSSVLQNGEDLWTREESNLKG